MTRARSPGRALLRDAAAIAAAMIAVGASFGAIAIAYGLPTWVPFLMSTVVFAGGAQFLAVGLLAAGNPIAAVLAGLLLNARHLPFGLAVSETIGPRWRDRLIGSHLMTDEVVAFTLAEPDPTRRRRTYWLIGVTLFTSWNLGTALGVLLGGVTGDPATLGLDAAFPAGLIALIMPSLRDRPTRVVALTGAAVAVALTPVLPAGLPVLCALVGLFTLVRPRRQPGQEKGIPDSPQPDSALPDGQADGSRAGLGLVEGRADENRVDSARAESQVDGHRVDPPSCEGGAGQRRVDSARAESQVDGHRVDPPSREGRAGQRRVDSARAESQVDGHRVDPPSWEGRAGQRRAGSVPAGSPTGGRQADPARAEGRVDAPDEVASGREALDEPGSGGGKSEDEEKKC